MNPRNIREAIFPYSYHDLQHFMATVTGSPSDYISAYDDDGTIFEITPLNSPYNDLPSYHGLDGNDLSDSRPIVDFEEDYPSELLESDYDYFIEQDLHRHRRPTHKKRRPRLRPHGKTALRNPRLPETTEEFQDYEEDAYANFAQQSDSIKSLDVKYISKAADSLSGVVEPEEEVVSNIIIQRANNKGDMVDWFPIMVTVSAVEDDTPKTRASAAAQDSLEEWWGG